MVQIEFKEKQSHGINQANLIKKLLSWIPIQLKITSIFNLIKSDDEMDNYDHCTLMSENDHEDYASVVQKKTWKLFD